MNRRLEDEIIEAIIQNDSQHRRPAPDPCCAALLEHPWPAWIPELARKSPRRPCGSWARAGAAWLRATRRST